MRSEVGVTTVVALAVLALAACQGDSAPGRAATSSAPRPSSVGSHTSPGAGGSVPPDGSATRNAAPAIPGRDYATVATLEPRHAGVDGSVLMLAVAGDGSIVVSDNPPPTADSYIGQSRVG